MMKNDKLNALTANATKPIVPVSPEKALAKVEKEIVDDYELSRNTLHNLIVSSETAIQDLLNLAQESEHPRTFEVLAGLIKTTADVTDRLMGNQKHRKDILKDNNLNPIPGNPGTVNNTVVFNGSTEDLQRMIKTQLENEKTIIPINEVIDI